MAQIGRISRLMNTTRVIPHTVCGSSMAATHSKLAVYHETFERKDDLCTSFSHLGITPLEARMSALASSSGLKLSQYHNKELRLPSLLKPVKITVPSLYSGQVLEKDLPPLLNYIEKIEPFGEQNIKETPTSQIVEKQAARLIVIRRKKMKKHKLKKLRKKMRFVWAKTRQRREYNKEKLFQATEMAKIQKFRAFDAKEYVADFLRQVNEKPIPRHLATRNLPEHVFQELLKREEEKEKRRQQKLQKQRDT